jgi:DNA-binding SARP family transcriptional activator
MPFEARALVPSGDHPQAAHPAFDDAAEPELTLFDAADDSLPTEGLAAALVRKSRRPIWLRLGPQDRDPGTFLVSLATSAARFGAANVTLELMRTKPGPVYGWPSLFARLGAEMGGRLSKGGALVLENVQHAWDRTATFTLLSTELLPALGRAVPCVLVACGSPPHEPPDAWAWRSRDDFNLPLTTARQALDEIGWPSSRHAPEQVTALAARPAVLAAIRAARSSAGPRALASVLERAHGEEDLLTQLAGVLLAATSEDGRRALALALWVEYTHPAMTSAVTGESRLPRGLWIQSLEDGWSRVRNNWRGPLCAALGQRFMPSRETLHKAADWLLQAGQGDEAISLYFTLGDHDCAARAISGCAEDLIDLGRWQALEGWLDRLPPGVSAVYPNFDYVRAEMTAARGDSVTAGHLYDAAAARYADRNDTGGASRSMLAASAAAANAGDLVTARARARAACSFVETAGEVSNANAAMVRMWATWQEGRVALVTGDTDQALTSFDRAAAVTSGGAAAEPIRKTGQFATRVAQLRREQEMHREAEAALRRAEHQVLGELLACVRAPGDRDGGVPGEDGWSDAPAVLKMPGLADSGGAEAVGRWSWTRLRGLRHGRHARGAHVNGSHGAVLPPNAGESPGFPPVQFAAMAVPPTTSRAWPARSAGPMALAHAVPEQAVPEGASPRHAAPRRTAPGRTAPGRLSHAVHAQAEVSVHLLGPMSVVIDDVPVDDWSSTRIRSLFGYLLTHRQPWPAREVLMEVFWPESSPKASRNSLNVAIHGLRRVLRNAKDVPVIVYSGGSYRLHPDVHLWLDVEEFDKLVERGRLHEDAGETDQATAAYEFATGLYRGEFLADDPYDDWGALIRERLRLAYLDTLGRLSNLHFNAGQYAASANLCQRIIEQDPCREDAYRRLMRCYSRQGQPHLALIQYRACVRTLESELGVEPDLATVELHNQIRRHERV